MSGSGICWAICKSAPCSSQITTPAPHHSVFDWLDATQPLPHLLNNLFSRTSWVSQYQKGKSSLDLNKARDDGVWDGSGISWTICKQPAPHSRQTTTPAPHQSVFNRPDALPAAQPTASKHWSVALIEVSKIRYLTVKILHSLQWTLAMTDLCYGGRSLRQDDTLFSN